MIEIVNYKKKVSIYVDDKHDSIIFTPKDYEEDFPSMLIEMKGFDFERHALKCPDCGTFLKDLYEDSVDWYIIWDNKKYRLQTGSLGKGRDQILIQRVSGGYFSGTRLKLLISTETPEKLQNDLSMAIATEDYERCVVIRDRIERLSD